jgi:hypothetical protein
MSRDEIVRLAQEAAIMPPNWGATENQWRSLHAFAELVAAAEREQCAKVCEEPGWNAANWCAKKIRERNN